MSEFAFHTSLSAPFQRYEAAALIQAAWRALRHRENAWWEQLLRGRKPPPPTLGRGLGPGMAWGLGTGPGACICSLRLELDVGPGLSGVPVLHVGKLCH